MAMKLALTASLLALLVTLAAATTYTTTVTTTTFEDESDANQQRQQCQRQLQGRQFHSCQRYLSSSWQQAADEQDDDQAIIGRGRQQPRRGQPGLRECCEQLQDVNEQCRCEAIKHAVRQLQQEQTRGQFGKVYQKAEMLPQMCNMRPQQCQFRVVFV